MEIEITDADVEAVERAVGMGHGAWDMVDPKEILRACLRRSSMLPRAVKAANALREIRDAKQKWTSGVGSYAGGETNAAFASRLQKIAADVLQSLDQSPGATPNARPQQQKVHPQAPEQGTRGSPDPADQHP